MEESEPLPPSPAPEPSPAPKRARRRTASPGIVYYVLRDRRPVPVRDVLVWGRMFADMAQRRVAEDVIEQPEHDPVRVSTVFLGIDHNFTDIGPPLLFESMVFGGPLHHEQYRYSTWDEAEAGHRLLTEEAVLEGKVSTWEVREMLRALSASKKKEQD